MKTFARLAAGLCICAIASQANAWSQPTHKNIVKDALAFMNSSTPPRRCVRPTGST